VLAPLPQLHHRQVPVRRRRPPQPQRRLTASELSGGAGLIGSVKPIRLAIVP